MNRILITGGCGFVGSSLALRLQRDLAGCEVVVYDNFYRHGSRLNEVRVRQAGIQVVEGDVRDIPPELGPFDLVVDAAAEPSVMAGKLGDDSRYVVDTNLGGTVNCLEASRLWSARMLFLSTSRIYPVDALRSLNLTETDTRFELSDKQESPGVSSSGITETFGGEGARTLYGATKYAGEIMVHEYAQQFDTAALINRCGVIAGPWQMGRVDQGVVSLWAGAHCYGRPLSYIGYGGKQVRDVLHIEDLADLVLAQIARDDCWDGQLFNVGGGRDISFSLRELTALTEIASGSSLDLGDDPAVREGDVPLYITDASRATAEFQWNPSRSTEDIVNDTVGWIRDNQSLLEDVFRR
jgi:CDP-paratose 2-epimerase